MVYIFPSKTVSRRPIVQPANVRSLIASPLRNGLNSRSAPSTGEFQRQTVPRNYGEIWLLPGDVRIVNRRPMVSQVDRAIRQSHRDRRIQHTQVLND